MPVRAQYYGICFLSQFHLDKDDGAVADHLIRVYFSFFKANIKKGEIDSRLMSAILTGVKRAYPFADRSRLEENSEHVAAVHRIVHYGQFNMAIHALSLLYHISEGSDGLSQRYYCALYRKLNSTELFNSTHCALLFGLIYKSLKRDENAARVTAFVRRCVRLATHMNPAHACGMLFLLSQVSKDKNKSDVIKLQHAKEIIKEENQDKPSVEISRYDAYARNPVYAGAELTACAELLPLASHFHPAVRLFARQLIGGEMIRYSGDPLKDFSGVRFLDRFAFKNPKQRVDVVTQNIEGGVKKVKGSHPKFALRKNYTAKGLKSLAVTSASYLNEDSKKIPVDELFLYKYLQAKRYRESETQKSEEEEMDSDADSVTSEDFNVYLDRVTGVEQESDEDEGDERPRLDFMSAVSEAGASGHRNNKRQTEEEVNGEDLALSSNDSDQDDDDLSLEGDSEDEDPKRKGRQGVKRGGVKGDTSSLFASAEEFSALLEEAGAERGQGTSGATEVGGRGGGNAKQVAWEEKRHTWLSGYRRKFNAKAKTVKRSSNGGDGRPIKKKR